MENLHQLFIRSSRVVTDTRKIKQDCMFFALKGDNFNGNLFAAEALNLGAKFAVVDDSKVAVDERFILVPNVLEALQQLALFHRKKLDTKIIALTGSNGKTTTKELIDVVLKTKFKTVATVGNLNNHIGVPLTLLSIEENTEIAIVEMGANHQKEIQMLCNLAMPDFGYITNFGKAHLEGFGGVEGVIKGKSEMYDHLRMHKKVVFVNGDDALQMSKTKNDKRYVFGACETADLLFTNISANPTVFMTSEDVNFKTNMIGMYNASNVMAAIAIGKYFGVNLEGAAVPISNYSPSNNRSQIVEKGSVKILLDAYNANPSSMVAAIENFAQLSEDNRLMVLGDMFELGDESEKEHRDLVEMSATLNDVESIFVGPKFNKFKNSNPSAKFLPTFEEAKMYFENRKFADCTMLIKGSRGMALERLLDVL